MKKFLCLCVVMLTALSLSAVKFERGPRHVRISGQKEAVKSVEIVIPVQTPLLSFAAGELEFFLKKAGGVSCTVVSKPSGKALALVLGENALSRAAGLDVKKLASEGFYIKRKDNMIFLLGEDSSDADPGKNRWRMWMKKCSTRPSIRHSLL
jgi:hypothetical protein